MSEPERPLIERRRRMASRRVGPYIAAKPFAASQATTFDVNVGIERCATKA